MNDELCRPVLNWYWTEESSSNEFDTKRFKTNCVVDPWDYVHSIKSTVNILHTNRQLLHKI